MNVLGKDFLKEQADNLREFIYVAQTLGYGNENARGEIVKEGESCSHYAENMSIFGSQPRKLTQPGESMKEYASGIVQTDFSDGRHTIRYADGNWLYEDSWVGGEPYAGMTTVWFRGVVCWSMVYMGGVRPGVDKEDVYPCLWMALSKVSLEHPWRGPEYLPYHDGKHHYHNEWTGDLANFDGEEKIVLADGEECYRMKYHGGVVNLS